MNWLPPQTKEYNHGDIFHVQFRLQAGGLRALLITIQVKAHQQRLIS